MKSEQGKEQGRERGRERGREKEREKERECIAIIESSQKLNRAKKNKLREGTMRLAVRQTDRQIYRQTVRYAHTQTDIQADNKKIYQTNSRIIKKKKNMRKHKIGT